MTTILLKGSGEWQGGGVNSCRPLSAFLNSGELLSRNPLMPVKGPAPIPLPQGAMTGNT